MVILGIIPFFLLSFLTFRIHKATPLNNSGIKVVLDNQCSINSQNSQNRSKNVLHKTKVLVGIVVVFLLCHGLRTLVQIFLGACELGTNCGGIQWHPMIVSFSNFFIIFNSSIKCVIYGFISKRFRRECSKTIVYWVESISLEEMQHLQQAA